MQQIQNIFLTAQSMQIKSVTSVSIKDCIHHYLRVLCCDIPRVGAYFYDIPGSGRTFTTYPGRAQFNDIPGSNTCSKEQRKKWEYFDGDTSECGLASFQSSLLIE